MNCLGYILSVTQQLGECLVHCVTGELGLAVCSFVTVSDVLTQTSHPKTRLDEAEETDQHLNWGCCSSLRMKMCHLKSELCSTKTYTCSYNIPLFQTPGSAGLCTAVSCLTNSGLPGSHEVSIWCRMSNSSASVQLVHRTSWSCLLAAHHSEWNYMSLLMISDPPRLAVSVSSKLELSILLGFPGEAMLSRSKSKR